MAFKVEQIINGKTIQVVPSWNWNNLTGHIVEINGLNPIDDLIAKSKLELLVKDKLVELKNPISTGVSSDNKPKIVCSVYVNDVNILDYFPELKLGHGYTS